MSDAFDELASYKQEKIEGLLLTHTIKMRAVTPFWNKIDIQGIDFSDYNNIKYLEDRIDGAPDKWSQAINNIPKDSGGLYFFFLVPPVLGNHIKYLVYIGRAQYTASENLRTRIKCYLKEERPKLERLLRVWGEFLYVKYIPINGNEKICSLEKSLINGLLPPFNTEIPDTNIRKSVNALQVG